MKKLYKKKQIAITMSNQSFQNIINLKIKYIKIIKLEINILINIKIYYLLIFNNFILL